MIEVIQQNGELLPSECENLIQASETVGFIGSDDLASLNFPEYSGNFLGKNSAKVLLVEDEALAAILWDRLQEVILNKAPISTLQTQIYGTFKLRAYAICPLMRILRCEEGQQFKPHVDGVDLVAKGPGGEVCRSRLTLALYLNKQDNTSTTATTTGPKATDTTSDAGSSETAGSYYSIFAPSRSQPCPAP